MDNYLEIINGRAKIWNSFNSISHECAQLFYSSNVTTLRKGTYVRNDFTLVFLFYYLEDPKDGTMALTSHGIFVVMAFFMVSSLIL